MRPRNGVDFRGHRSEYADMAIVASAVEVTQENAQRVRRRRMMWQIRAMDYTDLIPEAHYASDFFGDGLGRIKLIVQRDATGSGSWQEVKGPDAANDPAVQVWNTVQDPSGGRYELQSRYGRLVSLACGDGYLVASWDPLLDRVMWEFLSVSEITPLETSTVQQRYQRRSTLQMQDMTELELPPPGQMPSTPGEAIVWRMWRSDPRFSEEADAPMRGCLDVLEELHLSTLAIRSHLRSRLSRAGVLLIDDSVTTVPVEATADEDPNEDITLRDMAEHFMAPIENDGSAAAVVPYLLRVDASSMNVKVSDLVAYVSLYSNQDDIPEVAIRQEAVERFARGIKLPVEVILGMADANHWSGWLIDDMIWQSHLQPEAQRMASDFTNIFLRPQLKANGVAQQEYRIWYDPSDLVVNPDRSKDAKDLHDRLVISDKALRSAANFTEEDAPSPANPNSSPGGIVQPPTASPGTGDKGPPSQNAASVGGFLDGARLMAEVRCREKAGARIRAKLSGAGRAMRYEDIPNDQLAAELGREGLRLLDAKTGASRLVAGGADHLKSLAPALGLSAAEAAEVCREVEADAAASLFSTLAT